MKTEPIVVPGLDHPVHSSGILDSYGDQFTHQRCLVHQLHDDELKVKWTLDGRQANVADFVIDSARPVKGWGCWSAHANMGYKGQYQERMGEHP